MDDSSSGDETAVCAASADRFSPDAVPMPIRADPASDMIAASGESRLTIPGTVMKSVIPWTHPAGDVIGQPEASMIEVRFSTTWSGWSFSITISVSTLPRLLDPHHRLVGTRDLEAERPRDDADGQRSELARDLSDDRCAAGARAAAFAHNDEHHVRAFDRVLQLVAALGRRGLPDLRVRART